MMIMQSFLAFFYLLEQCYLQCQEDDLGGFLGAISPEIWEDGQPIDKAILIDWQKNRGHLSADGNNLAKVAFDFLEYYEHQFGYNFVQTKQCLCNADNRAIENAIIKAREMCEKYHYSNEI